ncbi:MAG: glutamate 5-kinase [Aquificae bacterium]|nr:glutamate 5-kinase [Aquificota bacterium]
MDREKAVKQAKKIVIKIGSQLLEKSGDIDTEFIENLSSQVKTLKEKDIEVLVVSSGAILAGIKKLNLTRKPQTISEKQAVSAVGQAFLMQIYDKIFSKKGMNIGQILLTLEGLRDRKRYNYARQTLEKLLEFDVVPIINENDTVAVEEIVFGDNDFLAAHVSTLVKADLLIILSTAGGVYTGDPLKEKVQLIKEIKDIEKSLKFAKATKSRYGSGGMRSKLEAAKIAVSQGIPVIIAPKKENILEKILLQEEPIGTYIYPHTKKKVSSKKRWLASLSYPKGRIIVDKGAQEALKEGKSLLPAGIKSVEGIFSKKDVVAVLNEEEEMIGKGIVNYSYKELKKIAGKKTKEIEKILKKKPKEVIHTDDMVIFS